jgi:hypothetical protein
MKTPQVLYVYECDGEYTVWDEKQLMDPDFYSMETDKPEEYDVYEYKGKATLSETTKRTLTMKKVKP